MSSSHHSTAWLTLDALEEPTDGGRVLGVGGFVLADPFDIFLRQISAEYLQSFCDRVNVAIRAFRLELPDLSWGIIHCGTRIPKKPPSPKDFIGLTSRLFYTVDDDVMQRINVALPQDSPAAYCMALWRSLKWRIAPDDYHLALQLIEALCTDELTEWVPANVLSSHPQANEPWVKLARAIRNDDQRQLDQAAHEAKDSYSRLGYRIVARAYGLLLQNGADETSLRFPEL